MRNYLGFGNKIAKGVLLGKNIKIGNNNIIYPDVKIYDNTTIGNNNIILSGNILGEYPIHSKGEYKDLKRVGLTIGDNNFFHINNLVFSGFKNQTIIGNNNKILAEVHIGHDAIINNYITLFTQTTIGGHTILLDYSGLGMASKIHQNLIIGQYSFVGMNNTITKNVFPFFINLNNQLHRFNNKRIEEINKINIQNLIDLEQDLRDLNKEQSLEEIKLYIQSNFKDNSLIRKILIEYYSNIFKNQLNID
jgi:UDP-N-acetylglucosamine acyltransferase